MKRLWRTLREPVLLFFLLGFLLFLLYARTTGMIEQRKKQIYVSQAQIEELHATFERTWNRLPSEEERSTLLNNLIMDEIF